MKEQIRNTWDSRRGVVLMAAAVAAGLAAVSTRAITPVRPDPDAAVNISSLISFDPFHPSAFTRPVMVPASMVKTVAASPALVRAATSSVQNVLVAPLQNSPALPPPPTIVAKVVPVVPTRPVSTPAPVTPTPAVVTPTPAALVAAAVKPAPAVSTPATGTLTLTSGSATTNAPVSLLQPILAATPATPTVTTGSLVLQNPPTTATQIQVLKTATTAIQTVVPVSTVPVTAALVVPTATAAIVSPSRTTVTPTAAPAVTTTLSPSIIIPTRPPARTPFKPPYPGPF